MFKSLLVLLNGARSGHQASDLARHWAGLHQALCVGLSVLDVESLGGDEPASFTDMSAVERRDRDRLEVARSQLKRIRAQFGRSCTQSNVFSQLLDAEGSPAEVIAYEAQRCDLVLVDCPQSCPVLGRLNFEQLAGVVKHCPRPLIVVPDRPNVATNALIAQDGSLQATRATQAFVHSGLARERQVHVVAVAENPVTATRRVDGTLEFLNRHNIVAQAVPIATEDEPAAVLLDHLTASPAGLLVMGVFGKNMPREAVFGSVTRRLLEHCPAPIFLYH